MEENNNNTDRGAVDTIKKTAKKQADKIKKKIALKITAFIAPVIGILLISLLAIGVIMASALSIINFFKGLLGIDASTAVSSSQTVQAAVSITNSGYKINKEYSKQIAEELERQMIDMQEMGFSGEEEMTDMINKYIETEIKTMFPITGKGTVDGLIKINRMSAETGEVKQLEYMDYSSFCHKINQQDETALNPFSLNPDTFDLCLATSEVVQYYDYDQNATQEKYLYAAHDESKRQVRLTLREVEYQTTIQKYATPLNYLVSMHLISADTEFMNELVEMIYNKTDIELTFLESTYKKLVQVEYEGDMEIHTYKKEYTEEGEPYLEILKTKEEDVNTKNSGDYKENPFRNTNHFTKKQYLTEYITTNGNLYITKANTWRLNSQINVQKNDMRRQDIQIDELTNDINIDEYNDALDFGPDSGKYKEGEIDETTNEWDEYYDISTTEGAEGYNPTSITELIESYPKVMNNFKTSSNLLFYLLEENENTQELSNFMRYIIYNLTGTDYGVTDIESIFDLSAFKGISVIRVNYLKEYIRSWEGHIPEYSSDGKMYKVKADGTVGYGVDVYKNRFKLAGYETNPGDEIPIEVVDKIEEDIIDGLVEDIEEITAGLDLTTYQIHALASRAYVSGYASHAIGFTNKDKKNFKEVYKEHWNQDRDDKYEEKDNNADFSHKLYEEYLSILKDIRGNNIGNEERLKSEWTLFQTGYYTNLGKWHFSGEDILEAADLIHQSQINWTYSVGGDLYWNNIEMSLNNPHRVTCCATFVSSAIYTAGYFTESQMNSFNYNECKSLYNFLTNAGWQVIGSYDQLEPGDIIFMNYENGGKLHDHTQIYAGDDTWYNAGSTDAIRRASPYTDKTRAKRYFLVAVRAQ